MEDTDRILLLYLGVVNLSAFLVYRRDKLQAIRRKSRTPEKTLLSLALFGGGPGALLAMVMFRHKTRHAWFRILVPLGSLLWLLALMAGFSL